MNPSLISTTEAVDSVFIFILGVSVLMLLGITGAILYFVIRYNRSRNPVPTSDVDSNLGLEVAWTLIPTLLVLAMFYYGWAGFLALRNVPEGAMTVDVTGRMWSWSFKYENGRTSDRLQVPVGQPIRVRIHSADVLHSFYIPAFRVKRDAVPGMETYLWFTAAEPGSYDIYCAEYCGLQHAAMITTVEALPREQFEAWYAGSPPAGATDDAQPSVPAGPSGAELVQSQGCLGCHSTDGTDRVGPSFKGIFNRPTLVERGGKEVEIVADEDYLKRSITEPQAETVKGFAPMMPPYPQLSEQELKAIVEYLEGLR